MVTRCILSKNSHVTEIANSELLARIKRTKKKFFIERKDISTSAITASSEPSPTVEISDCATFAACAA